MNVLAKLTYVAVVICFLKVPSSAQIKGFEILNESRDISNDFSDFKNTYYRALKLAEFNPET